MKDICCYCEEEFDEGDLQEVDYCGYQKNDLACDPCLQGRWEKQQERDLSDPPPSIEEQYLAARYEKYGV